MGNVILFYFFLNAEQRIILLMWPTLLQTNRHIYACCLIAHIQAEAMRADVSESQSESESESVYVWIACQSANLSHVCIL